jgi:6-pyruvoyl-tetrahydropterin synthase
MPAGTTSGTTRPAAGDSRAAGPALETPYAVDVARATNHLLTHEQTAAISGGEFRFSSAHTGLHDGRFEAMHGHTYLPTLTLTGVPDAAGMIVDFRVVRAALREAIAPLRSRTLLAGAAGPASPTYDGASVRFTDGVKVYVLPSADVVLLPMSNTSTEQLAAYLLAQVTPAVRSSGVRRVVLELAESPGTTVAVSTTVRGSAGAREGDHGGAGGDR